MPGWKIETPEEIAERENERRQALLESQVEEYTRQLRYWAKEIFIFHELYNLSLSGSPCFNHMLIGLIRKADPVNTEYLRQGFPEAVKMVEEWEASDPWDFYELYEVRKQLQGSAAQHYDRRSGVERDEEAESDL